VVLREGSAKARTYRSGLPAADLRSGGLLSSGALPEADKGLTALVTRLITPRERVEILIEWMGRTLRAEAGVTDLEPLARETLVAVA
jgi:hypothetical protein